MDFNDNQKEADFRIKVREFLDKNAKKKSKLKINYCECSCARNSKR
jgi:hypothetical protein